MTMGRQRRWASWTNQRMRRRVLLNRATGVAGAVVAVAVLPGSAAAEALAPIGAPGAAWISLSVAGLEIAEFAELGQLPPSGAKTPPTVTLKRGKNSSSELWAWNAAVVQGNPAAARKSCSLVMYNVDGKPVARYHLEAAWPSKLEVDGLSAGPASLTLSCAQLQREFP